MLNVSSGIIIIYKAIFHCGIFHPRQLYFLFNKFVKFDLEIIHFNQFTFRVQRPEYLRKYFKSRFFCSFPLNNSIQTFILLIQMRLKICFG